MDLKNQKRMAREIFKCGKDRVYLNPMRSDDIAEAVTREDIRTLIKAGAISKRQIIGASRAHARHIKAQKDKGKRKGQGSRKGAKYARYPRKRRWIDAIRPIRELLKFWRDNGFIDKKTYRQYYLFAKGGQFRNKGHMMAQMELKKVFLKPAHIPNKGSEVN